ncbi:MAG: hypothetical protein ACYTGQ_04425 [Planctomycetota bacterium]
MTLLLLLALLWGALGWAVVAEWPSYADGAPMTRPHEDHPAMSVGAGITTRDEALWWPGLFLGLSVVLLLVYCIGWGVGFGGSDRRFSVGLALGGVLFGGVFIGMMRAWTGYLAGDAATLGSFPAAAGWVVYGVWLAPVVFIGLYVIGFHRWVYTPEDERRFQGLKDQRDGGRGGRWVSRTPC